MSRENARQAVKIDVSGAHRLGCEVGDRPLPCGCHILRRHRNPRAYTALFDQIAAAAVKGEEVTIPGFGKFTVKDRPERDGRNPATGEAIKIAASKKVAFTAAKGLKDKL